MPLRQTFFPVFFSILLKAEMQRNHLYITEREHLLWPGTVLFIAKIDIGGSSFSEG